MNMVRLNKIKKQISPDKSRVNTHRASNILFEHCISDSKTVIFGKECYCLNKVFFSVKYLLPKSLEVQYIEVVENPILLRTFDLKQNVLFPEEL